MDRQGVEAGLLSAQALFYSAPRKTMIKPVNVPFMTENSAHQPILVKTLWSGLSRGTERLIFEGMVPHSEFERMRCPFQKGDFPFPVQYGYMSVGVVEHGPSEIMGCVVFALHPHQTLFTVPREALALVPDGVPAKRAILTANMETALNAVWDGNVSPGDRVVVVGAGALGLLITHIAAQIPGTEVFVVDVNATRLPIVRAFGAMFAEPQAIKNAEADVVFHTSASPSGLHTSLQAAGYGASIVEVSWYGSNPVPTCLGEAFHSRRLKLISSQVGGICATRSARWTHKRRLEMALNLLHDERLDLLITDEVAFEALPNQISAVFEASDSSIVTAIRYNP